MRLINNISKLKVTSASNLIPDGELVERPSPGLRLEDDGAPLQVPGVLRHGSPVPAFRRRATADRRPPIHRHHGKKCSQNFFNVLDLKPARCCKAIFKIVQAEVTGL